MADLTIAQERWIQKQPLTGVEKYQLQQSLMAQPRTPSWTGSGTVTKTPEGFEITQEKTASLTPQQEQQLQGLKGEEQERMRGIFLGQQIQKETGELPTWYGSARVVQERGEYFIKEDVPKETTREMIRPAEPKEPLTEVERRAEEFFRPEKIYGVPREQYEKQLVGRKVPEGELKYKYTVGIEYPEQAEAIRQYVEKRGGVARRVGLTEETPSKLKMEIRSPVALIDMPVPSAKEIERERGILTATKLAKETYEKATPIEKVGITARTVFSPEGFEYLGSQIAKRTKLKETYKIKEPEMIVTEKLAKEIISAPQETYEEARMRGYVEFIQSPVFEVESAFLGGTAVAKIGATKIGGKLLSMKASKIALAGIGAVYVVERGIEVKTLSEMGKIEEAVGKASITGVSISGAIAGARLETTHILSTKGVDIDLSYIRGVSATIREDTMATSKGIFEAITPKGRIRGATAGIVKMGKEGKITSEVVYEIPKQKVGKVTIEPTRGVRYGEIEKVSKKLHRVKTSDVELKVGEEQRLIGRERGVSLVKEVGKAKVDELTLRAYKVASIETAPKEYTLRGAVKGYKMIVDVERKGLERVGLQASDWVDVSKRVNLDKVKPVDIERISKPKMPDKVEPPPTTITALDPRPVPPTVRVKAIGRPSEIAKIFPSYKKTSPISTRLSPLVSSVAETTRLAVKGKQETRQRQTPLSRLDLTSLQAISTEQVVYPIEETVPATATMLTQIQTQIQLQKSAIGTRLSTLKAFDFPPPPTTIPIRPVVPKPPIPPLLPFPYLKLWMLPSAMKGGKYKTKWLVHPVPSPEVVLWGKNKK